MGPQHSQRMESKTGSCLPMWLQHMGLGIEALLPFPIRTHPSVSFPGSGPQSWGL